MGDEYQDVQSLDVLVAWLENNDRYEWVELEADSRGYLDDIVIKRADGVIELRQIKFSTASYKIEDALSWQILLETKSDSKTSLLQKWYRSWEKQLSSGSIQPFLLSNRRPAPDLTIQFTTGTVVWNEIPEETKQIIVGQLGSAAHAKKFLEAFTFRLNEPSLRELETGAYTRFLRLGGTVGGWRALERAVREWTNIKNNPPPQGRISLDDVRHVAKLKAHPVQLKTFLPPVTFFAPYLDQNRLFHHRLPQVGRRRELQDLLSFVKGNDQIAILPGRGGSGKSKLIHTLSRRLARLYPELSVRLAAEGLTIDKGALEELPDDSCLIIVDDAHRSTGLEVILAAARQNAELKVLLVTRPHATDYLVMHTVAAGFDRDHVIVNSVLTDLNYSLEHRQLARRVLGSEWKHYADELASVTRDSPLLTVIGGELLRTHRIPPSSLTQNQKFQQEVLSRFRDVQLGEIVLKLDGRYTEQFCSKVLQIIAALSPIDLGNESLVHAMAELSGADEVELKQFLGRLVKAGVVVRGGRFVRIVPDVLSDFILQDACFAPDGLVTGWATQVYEKVADFRLDVLLRNLAELDWRMHVAPNVPGKPSSEVSETGLLDFIWRDIEEKFRIASLKDRKAWLGRLERIAFIQPHRIWAIVEIARNEPAPVLNEPSDIGRALTNPITHEDVISALVPVLRGIARDDRFTARCADLLWEIGRDQPTKTGQTPLALGALRELASYRYRKTLVFSQIVLACCHEWINDPKIHEYRHSVLSIISVLLSRRSEGAGTNEHWQSHSSVTPTTESFWELRRAALNLVESCAFSAEPQIVLEALKILRTPISEEYLWELKNDNQDEWQTWEAEQLAALEIAASVVKTNDDPFVRLRIWEACSWQAQHGPRTAVRSRALEVLESVPLSFESRLILLITGNHGSEEYSQTSTDNAEDQDRESGPGSRILIEAEQRRIKNEEFARKVIVGWIENYPDPLKGFDTFGDWIERIETSEWWNELWTRSNPFLLQVASDFPRYAEAWCAIAIEKPEARTTRWCPDLLCEIRRQDPPKALSLAKRFLTGNHSNLWLCVAASYSWRCWPVNPLPDEIQILRDLLAFDDIRVKRSAADILSAFATVDFSLAIEMILQTQIGSDTELAEKLFGIFEERRRVNLDDVDKSTLQQLLIKLEDVESVRNYHLGRFLAQAALRDPVAVVELLLDRVQTKVKRNEERLKEPFVDLRSQMLQMIDTFGGLPQSGFHEEEFKQVGNHPNYCDALRLIRDAAISQQYSSVFLYEDTLSELFHDFSLNFSPSSLDVLNEWINSGDCEKLTAVLELLEDAYLGFFIKNLSFLSNYLRRARDCGLAVFEKVEQALLSRAQYGPRRAIASHRGQRSNALFHGANEALESIHDDSLTVRFFEQIRDSGREMIQSEMREVEEEQVFFRG